MMSANDGFFPVVDRVIYDHSPLAEVICQCRFPTILKIGGELPVAFQEAVRDVFPIYSRAGNTQIPPEIPEPVRQMILSDEVKSHKFTTEDGQVSIDLSNEAISLTTKRYTQWEKFTLHLQMMLDALSDVYRPSYYSRIGLRYLNALAPSDTSDQSMIWSNLISDNIIGEVRFTDLGNARVTESHTVSRLVNSELSEGVVLQHGLGKLANNVGDAYIIDIDCYKDSRTEVKDAINKLTVFNSRARHGFRWCITDFAHGKLGPKPVR